MRRILREVSFPTLAELGVTEADLPALVDAATGDQRFFLEIDAHDWTREEVEAAFRAALAVGAR